MADEKKADSVAVNYEAIYNYIVETLTSEAKSQEARLTNTSNCFEYLKATVSVEAVKSILAFVKGLAEHK